MSQMQLGCWMGCQEARATTCIRIALSVFLFALLCSGKPAVAQSQQPTPQIAQSSPAQGVYVPSRTVSYTHLTLPTTPYV